MADFRKWILVLALLAMAVVPASAQVPVPFVCSATSGVTPIIRAEGITELVGDLLLTCSGGNGGTILPNIQLFFNAVATSRLYSSSRVEALMMLDDPAPGVQQAGVNVFQGVLSSSTSYAWNGVPIPTVGQAATALGSVRIIRFTNLRVNANTVSGGQTLLGTTVQVAIAVTGSQGMSISTGQQQSILAYVQPGFSFSLSGAGGTFQQCVDHNGAIAGDNTKAPATVDFTAKFKEGFASSFKTIGGLHGLLGPNGLTSDGITAYPDQNVPGVLYFTESGFLTTGLVNAGAAPTGLTQWSITDTNIGQASQGTRLFVRFANIPAGVQIFVSALDTTGSDSTIDAVWVGNDPTAAGNFGNPTNPPASLVGGGNYEAVSLSGGTGTAVWEIIRDNPNSIETVAFGVVVAYKSNTTSNLPGLTITNAGTTPATAGGGFAPVSTVTAASTSAPEPRFIDNSAQSTAFNIGPCVTNILFPYVTNQAGFDTGIALINTSLDNSAHPNGQPFNTGTQHGTCTVYYFNGPFSGGQAPVPQTTDDIPAGDMRTFALSSTGTLGAPGFQGYIIARCNFQFAHGYAFITDVGAEKLAHGYLALILPDRTRVPDPFTTAGAGSGEQLAF